MPYLRQGSDHGRELVASGEPRPPRAPLATRVVGATYEVSCAELGAAEAAAVLRELTMTPIDTYSAETSSFDAYALEGDRLRVPRFYGTARWGAATDDRTGEGEPAGFVFGGALSEVQRRCHASFMAHLGKSAGNPRGGIVVLPCGYGKTVFALHLAATLGRRTLVLVHKNFLVEQWQARARQFLPAARLGMLQQAHVEVDADLVVGMVQSIAKRDYPPEVFAGFGLVVIDEAHHLAAPVFSRALTKIPARYTLALSATPERKDGMGELLEWSMGPIVFRVQRETETVHVQAVHFEQARPRIVLNAQGRPVIAVMLNHLARNERRNRLIADFTRRLAHEGRHVIVMSDRIEQLQALDALIADTVESRGFYIGKSTAREREEAEHKRVLLTTYSMSREALDIPRLDTLVMASPVGNVEQVIGRILRKHPEKKTPLVIDIVDSFSVFECMRWKRRQYYASQAYEVEHVEVGG